MSASNHHPAASTGHVSVFTGWLAVAALLAWNSPVSAQKPVWQLDFEDCSPGPVVGRYGWGPGPGEIVTGVSHEGDRSLRFTADKRSTSSRSVQVPSDVSELWLEFWVRSPERTPAVMIEAIDRIPSCQRQSEQCISPSQTEGQHGSAPFPAWPFPT